MLNNSHVMKLFDRRFVANKLNNVSRCPKCRNEYSFYYDTADRFSNGKWRWNPYYVLFNVINEFVINKKTDR